MRLFMFVFLLIFFANIVSAEVFVNEIMYNPKGTDSKHEWIELYNNGTNLDISNWRLFENNIKHKLELVNGSFILEDYAVIVQDPEGFLEHYPAFNRTLIDSVFSLSNSGETIVLLDEGYNEIVNITYNDSMGAENNDRTLIYVDGQYAESGEIKGSPGKENGEMFQYTNSQDLRLEGYINDIVYINVEQDKLFKIVNVNPGFGRAYNISVEYNISKDNILIHEGNFIKAEINRYSSSSTGTFVPIDAGNYTLCGKITSSSITDLNSMNDYSCKKFSVIDTTNVACNISLNISVEKDIYQEKEKIKFEPVLNDETYPFILNYGISDLKGNEVKAFRNTTNTKPKTYTPKISEIDRVYYIRIAIVHLSCNDTDLTDNNAEKLVIINSSEKEGPDDSNTSIKIEKAYLGKDNKTEFGQLLQIRLEVYKGDERRSNVQIKVKNKEGRKANKVDTSFSLSEKFTRYRLTVPVQLKLNCEGDLKNGDYEVIAEGFGIVEKKTVKIEGITKNLCEVQAITNENKKRVGLNYNIKEYNKHAKAGDIIETVISIDNDDTKVHDIELWSYVFKGRKSYSGGKEENKEMFSINSGDSFDIILKNKLIKDIDAGEYTLRVNIRKDNQKTVNKLDEIILVEEVSPIRINKFYTLNKKPSREINIFSVIEGEGEARLSLQSFSEKIDKIVDIDKEPKVKFSVRLNQGKNLFFLILKKNNEIKDIKQMIVELNEDSLNTYTKEEDLEMMSIDGIQLPASLELIANNTLSPYWEDNVIYESSAQKVRRLLPQLIIGFMIMLCIAVVCKKVK